MKSMTWAATPGNCNWSGFTTTRREQRVGQLHSQGTVHCLVGLWSSTATPVFFDLHLVLGPFTNGSNPETFHLQVTNITTSPKISIGGVASKAHEQILHRENTPAKKDPFHAFVSGKSFRSCNCSHGASPLFSSCMLANMYSDLRDKVSSLRHLRHLDIQGPNLYKAGTLG